MYIDLGARFKMKLIRYYASIWMCITPFLSLLGQDKKLDFITIQFKILKYIFVIRMKTGMI